MRTLATLSALLIIAGCGKTAKIFKRNGKVVEGEITRGDSSHVYIVKARFPDDPRVRTAHLRGQEEPTVLPEVLEECITACKMACRKRHPSRHSRDEFIKCKALCSSESKTHSECQEFSTEIPIPRRNIMNISHPGKTLAITGSILTVVGGCVALLATPWVYSCGEWGCGSHELYTVGIVGSISAILGIIVGVSGYIKWFGSISAAKPAEHTGPNVRPVALTDGEQTYMGIGMTWAW